MDESGRPLPMICGSGVDAKLIKKFCFLNEFGRVQPSTVRVRYFLNSGAKRTRI
jgi:hypothetical protein